MALVLCLDSISITYNNFFNEFLRIYDLSFPAVVVKERNINRKCHTVKTDRLKTPEKIGRLSWPRMTRLKLVI